MGGTKFCTAIRDLVQRQRMMRRVALVCIPSTMNEQVVLHQIVLCKLSLPFWAGELDELVFQSSFQGPNGNVGVVCASIFLRLNPAAAVRRSTDVTYRLEIRSHGRVLAKFRLVVHAVNSLRIS